jgi:hypothetical protein
MTVDNGQVAGTVVAREGIWAWTGTPLARGHSRNCTVSRW